MIIGHVQDLGDIRADHLSLGDLMSLLLGYLRIGLLQVLDDAVNAALDRPPLQ